MPKATQPRRGGIWSTGFLISAQMLLTWCLANNVTWDRKLGAACGSRGDGWPAQPWNPLPPRLKDRPHGGWAPRRVQGKGSEAVLLGGFAEGTGLGAEDPFWGQAKKLQPPRWPSGQVPSSSQARAPALSQPRTITPLARVGERRFTGPAQLLPTRTLSLMRPLSAQGSPNSWLPPLPLLPWVSPPRPALQDLLGPS